MNLFQWMGRFSQVLERPFAIGWTSYTLKYMLVGLLLYGCGIALYYSSRENRRPGEEYGSAKWGNPKELNRKYMDHRHKDANIILTQRVRLGMDGYITQRNMNVLVVGGSGSGKTRFFCKPNIYSANCSYLVTDPKGELLRAAGALLAAQGYEVRVFNLIDPSQSDGYNPFSYIHSEKDVLTLIDNLEQLDQDTEALQAIGRARGCQFNILRYQQEDALNTVLPLGLKRIDATRTLTTECTAVLMPFKSQEIQDAGGIYYGVNAVSHNLIVCNRGNLLNGNGFITGVSGSGKSMAAKQEVSALALSTDHDIIIVDPEREYGELVRALGGEVITISASDPNGCHINALDLSEGYGDGKEPLVMKSEFIMSLYEQLMGADKIEPQEKSIIDRSVGNIYREYIKNFQGQPPTLKDLYDDLMKQVNPEAHRIALALELFTVGSLNVFSHQTNINTKSRILCFDIQDLGENLKSVGLLVMLDAIYNRVIQNRREGKYTHVYIDEIYLFFANGSGSGHSITNYSSEFLYKCWKRFRKYGATLTGITQNVEECLLSNTARMMFANSEFLLMLNQATTDREQLARLLGASDTQMSYVDNAPAGHGLIKVGGAIVPFANELPKNTELYRLMSTRPGED